MASNDLSNDLAKEAGDKILQADIVPANASSNDDPDTSSDIDEGKLTLAARRLLATEKAKQERMETLRRAQSTPVTSWSYDTNSEDMGLQTTSTSRSDLSAGSNDSQRGSIVSRFETAKVLQQKKEEERLARIKGESNRHSRTHSEKGINLKNVWAEALHESKNTEQSRVILTKQNTTQQIRWLDGSGIVKAKIGEWEELFMQIAATMDQLEDTLVAAHRRYLAYDLARSNLNQAQIAEEQRKFRESCTVAERFIIGDTHIYNAKFMESHVFSYLKHSLSDSRTRHIALSCGVYGEQANKPQIEVFAAAIKTDDNSLYVALTIKPTAEARVEAELYGLYKVAVFSKDIGQRLMERIVEVVPPPSWDETSGTSYYDMSPVMSDEGDGTWKYVYTPQLGRSASPSIHPAHVRTGEGDVGVRESMVGQEENYGRALSVATVGAARSFVPNLKRKESFEYAWAAEDEADDELPSAHQVTIAFDIAEVQTHYSSSNCFILAGTHNSVLFTGTLKSATTPNKYLIEDDILFEWMRGPATSGWLTKWPMKSQSIGTRTRRFFVLRDHLLSYYTSKPSSEEEVLENFSPNSLHLTGTSTVELSSYYFSRCIMITTPLDVLHIKAKDDDEEMRWYVEIKKAIDQQKRCKLFLSKRRIESIWYHESEHFSLIAVDAFTLKHAYVKTALFCYANTPFYSATSHSAANEVTLRANTYSVDIGTSETDRLQLELLLPNESPIIPSDLKCIKIFGDVLLLGGSKGYLAVGLPHTKTALPAAAAVSPSSPPLASPGEAPPQPSPKSSKKAPPPVTLALYCFSCTPSGGGDVKESLRFPHDPTSSITCFAVSVAHSTFFAADNRRVISIWSCDRANGVMSATLEKKLKAPASVAAMDLPPMPKLQYSINLSRIDPTGAYRDEKIKSLKLILSDKYLLVSTSNRLVLFICSYATPSLSTPDASPQQAMVTPPAANRGGAQSRLTAWVELDRGIPGTEGVFSMHLCETFVPLGPGSTMAQIKRKFIQWRFITSFYTELASQGTSAASKADSSVAPPQINPRTSFSRSFSFSRNMSTSPLPPVVSNRDGKECTLYRFEWSEEMFNAALNKAKQLEQNFGGK